MNANEIAAEFNETCPVGSCVSYLTDGAQGVVRIKTRTSTVAFAGMYDAFVHVKSRVGAVFVGDIRIERENQ